MTSALHTPLDTGDVVDLGFKRYRKQILPQASVDYLGRKIDFTRDKLQRIADSVARKAYDMVPILMDNGSTGHDTGPEATRGQLVGVELTDNGLDGIFDLNDAAAQLVADHPQVGVSCRIVEQLPRADGQTFTDALEHVLFTLRPRITGMSPWSAVSLANDEAQTTDLTEARYSTTTPGGPVADSPFTPEQAAWLQAQGLIKEAPAAAPVTPPQPAALSAQERLDAFLATMSPEDIAALDNALDEPTELPSVVDPATHPMGVGLSAEASNAIDLAMANAAAAQQDTLRMRTDLAAEKWKNTRAEFARQGVPPTMLNFAEPILSSPDSLVVDLAGDNKIDLAQFATNMLIAARGFIPLGTVGHSQAAMPGDGPSEAEARAFAAKYLPGIPLKPVNQGA